MQQKDFNATLVKDSFCFSNLVLLFGVATGFLNICEDITIDTNPPAIKFPCHLGL